MNVKKITAFLISLAFLGAMAGCNKQQKGTLNKMRSKTNNAFKEVDKAVRGTIKKVRDSAK